MIEEGDRGFAVGMTGSGKSKLLSYYFATFPGQRLLVDVNDDYELGPAAKEEGACVARHPSKIDFGVRTIRYVPARLNDDEYEELYEAIWTHVRTARHPLLLWLDEGEGPTTAQRSPLHLRLALKQGRKKKLTHLTATLRPVDVEKAIVNQSEHGWIFKMTDLDDIALLARRLNIKTAELAAALEQLPEYGFLYHRIGGPVAAFDPLSKERLQLAARHVRVP